MASGRDYLDVAALKGAYRRPAACGLGVVVEMSRTHGSVAGTGLRPSRPGDARLDSMIEMRGFDTAGAVGHVGQSYDDDPEQRGDRQVDVGDARGRPERRIEYADDDLQSE